MRKTIVVTALVLLLLACIMMVFVNGRYYDRKGIVTEIDNDQKKVVVTDCAGNEWSICADGLKLCDRVVLKMDNNKTENYIYDDQCVDFHIDEH